MLLKEHIQRLEDEANQIDKDGHCEHHTDLWVKLTDVQLAIHELRKVAESILNGEE